MKSSVRTQSGVLQSTTQIGEQSATTVYTFNTQLSDALTVITGANLKGNFKSPLPNEFRRIYQTWYSGSTYTSSGVSTTRRQVTASGIFQKSVATRGAPPDMPTELYNRVLSDVLGQIRSEIDLSVSIAEAGQTKKMFKGAQSILNYVLSFRRGRWKEAYRDFLRDGPVAKKAGSRWLEYQYGWKPLAQDLYDTAIQLARNFEPLMIAEARATESKTEVFDGVAYLGVPEKVSRLQSQRVYMKVRYKPSSDFNNLLSNFTSLNPASIAWELTPYSFVVDWFVDVGGYMRSMETALLTRNQFKDGFWTTGYLDTFVGTVAGGSSTATSSVAVSLNGAMIRKSYKKRQPMASMPTPFLPRFKCDLGPGRLLNAAALLSQHLGVKR